MNSFFVELKGFEIVLVAGPDAEKFLQGQLSCDVQALADNGFTYGAACNNKGRIFAAFILARHGTDFRVLLAAGLAQVFVANLQKFIPFYKCSMQIQSGLKSIGLAGSAIVETLERLDQQIPASGSGREEAGVSLYNLQADNTQFLLVADESAYPAIRSALSSFIPEAPCERWELTNAVAGHFPFSAEDVDKYTPQELHLDKAGYVSFTKGCYTGQEIIARMHYRGKVKKRLYLLQIANFTRPENEIEILDGDNDKLGSPIKLIPYEHTLFAIASLPVALTGTNLHTKEGESISYQPLTADVGVDS